MSLYEIFLAVIQVIVVGVIFALTQRFGKKFSWIVLSVMLTLSAGAVIYYQLTKEKPIEEMTLEERFDHYATDEQKKQCEEKPDACKEFYVGTALINTDEELALQQLISAYEHNVSGVVDDPTASEANLSSSIAELYRHHEPDHIWAQRWYEKSIAAGADEKLCTLGEMLMEDKNISKAREYLIRGDAKNLSACSSHLGQLYFEEGKGDEVLRLWLKAYLIDPYGKEINYYLGNLNVRMGKLKEAKYHYIIALEQLYKIDHIDIYDDYSGIKLKEIDASPLFVKRILNEGKFNIDHLKRWFGIVLNDNNKWKPAKVADTYVDLLGSTLSYSSQKITLSDTISDPHTGLGLNDLTISSLYELIYGQTPSKIDSAQREKTSALDTAIKVGTPFNYEGAIDGNFTLQIVYTPKNGQFIYEIKVKQ